MIYYFVGARRRSLCLCSHGQSNNVPNTPSVKGRYAPNTDEQIYKLVNLRPGFPRRRVHTFSLTVVDARNRRKPRLETAANEEH